MISIAMATYNGEKFLRGQLDSILAQTVTDWELVICDDCSADGTAAILREYAAGDGRIRIYANERNIGFKRNFEKAISLCTGDYVALSDQDDVWLPEHLEKLRAMIPGYSLACGNALMVTEENSDIGPLNEFEHLLAMPSPPQKAIYTVLLYRNCFQGASMMMSREFALNCMPVPGGIPFHDAWLAANACLRDGIHYTFDIITRYRQHGDNATSSMKNDRSKGFFRRAKSGILWLAGKHCIPTDRYEYCSELKKRYGLENRDFRNICTFMCHLEERKVSLSDIQMLWDNFPAVCTGLSRIHFPEQLTVWLMWKRKKGWQD